jgi:hypothetical protein
MSSLFGEPGPGGLFGRANDMVNNMRTNMQSVVPTGSWLLYLLVAFFIAAVIFMLMGKGINSSWLSYVDPRPKNWKILARASLFWAPSSVFTNLIVPKEKSVVDMHDDVYSITVENVLYNTRNYNTTEGPYRHILHRGSNELAKTTVGGAVLSGCITNDSGQLPPFGLPKRMNPGIFVDPNTNDIIVFVDTILGAETMRESTRIADIPLDVPARISVVLNKRVLEVYLNCKLEVTKVLRGDPKHVENEWYGLAGPAGAQAQIQNLYVWKESLSADDMRHLCPAIPVFSKERPICSGADTPISQAPSGQTTKINLGLGTSLTKKCG